ncbi:hypothetical protein MUO79_04130 [Candidatus Bathyarchaeota archaeon]|nr:hypothetical protein [Candidatus Bathyarchaeota archaeon]
MNCPNCQQTLITAKQKQQLVKKTGVNKKGIACPSCQQKYSLIAAVGAADYLLYLTQRRPLRAYHIFQRLRRQRATIGAMAKRSAHMHSSGFMWGRRPRFKHAWVFSRLHSFDCLKIRCTECNEKKYVAANPITIVQYVLAPYLDGAPLTKEEQKEIETLFIPTKQAILKLAKQEIEKKTRSIDAKKKQLEKLKSLCDVYATM